MGDLLKERPNPRYHIVVGVSQKEKRAGLFKIIDDPDYSTHVVDRSASKRVIDTVLFDSIQSSIDGYKPARVSLLRVRGQGRYDVVVADAQPMSASYNEILRRLRF